jgi:mitogen-activated protein kinase kinase kinase
MVRVTNYFDTQVQVPTGYLQEVHDSRRHHYHKSHGANGIGGGKEQMTNEQMVGWYGKILDSVRLRYRKLQRFAR